MARTEYTINDALAAALRMTRRAWRSSSVVSSENTGMLKGNAQRPGVLVLEANVSPVAIETEVLPATTVESEALGRLGQQVQITGRTILSSVAVRLPVRLRTTAVDHLPSELTNANDLEMALYTGSNRFVASRWPRSGWIRGTVADISIIVQSASVPPDVIEDASNELINGVSEAAGLLVGHPLKI